MRPEIRVLPEVVENQVFTVWNSQIPAETGIYWYEVDPWELWWLAENRENFTNWKEISVNDWEKFLEEIDDIQEDTFVYLPLMDLLKTAATWKELLQIPKISSRVLIISEAHPEISRQIEKSTNWKNISSSIKRLKEICGEEANS